MKLPDKPEFGCINGSYTGYISQPMFNDWYAKTFAGAVEVTGYLDSGNNPQAWSCGPDREATHTGLLINIQPIKVDSPEDILRDLAELHNYKVTYQDTVKKGASVFDLVDRARKYLHAIKR